MNMNQFTQKSLAAIQGAQDIALEYGHQQIEQAHLLMALVQDGEGLIPQLLTNMGLTLPASRPPSSTRWRSCPGSPVEAGRRTRSMWLRTWTVP